LNPWWQYVADLVLQLEGISKSYNIGTMVETEVLHGIDIDIQHGEFCALIGPSGSGKSTLLNIVGLLDRPTAGRLSIAGHDTGTLDDRDLTRLRGRSIGFVFQYHHLLGAFSAVENVMMPLLVERGFPSAAMERRAADLLASVGLSKWKDSKAGNLSGGQQQRVAIARALAMNPPIVLADEPTGNLDTASADAVFSLMQQVNRLYGTTFVIVTHNVALAERCPRILEVIDGRLTGDRVGQHAAAAARV
jgi:lipoprotein-releasing system ATP-binding protein